MVCKTALCRELCRGGLDLARTEGFEKVASEEDALTLAAREALFDQMINPGVHGLATCQRNFQVAFVTAAGFVHQLMEARDERRLLKLQREGTPTALCRLLTGVTPNIGVSGGFHNRAVTVVLAVSRDSPQC
jgi:hypothetical protein